MKHANTKDANNRAARTFWQGMGVAVLLALSAVVLDLVGKWTHDDVLDGNAWIVLVTSGVQAVMTAIASYVQRVLELTRAAKAVEDFPAESGDHE